MSSSTLEAMPTTDNTTNLLSVERVSVEFGGLRALGDVSMTARRGEIVGLIGPNGAGKTTLFNAICGFVRPNAGSITYDGKSLARVRPHDLSKLGIARTLQGVGLCPGMSVIENVMLGAQPQLRADFASALLGLWRSSREERRVAAAARSLLEELDISTYARRLPPTLPYAVQKRVALCRALLAEPTMLLLDEPASGLSGHEMADLVSLMRQLISRMGILLVEHHMDLVTSVCDRVVVLNFGHVIADGTPQEIRSNPEVTTAYLGDEVQSDGNPLGGVRA